MARIDTLSVVAPPSISRSPPPLASSQDTARAHGPARPVTTRLRDAGYRLVDEVRHEIVTVLVVAVGKWERVAVYKASAKR